MTPAEISTLISVIDLTSLNDNDTAETIVGLCHKAATKLGPVTAVCIYPKFVTKAWELLINTPIKIATVANFPSGKNGLNNTLAEIKQAILDGATEIDVVMPYYLYLNQTPLDNNHEARDFISECKNYCGQKVLLKIILETGALTAEQIQIASNDAIAAGADFLKTSTGKIATGATIEAATIILNTIKSSHKTVGCKVSGGIRTSEQALSYLSLVHKILGPSALTPQRFRIGASTLLDTLLEKNYE